MLRIKIGRAFGFMTSLSGRFIFRVCNSKFTKTLIDQIVFIKSKFVIYRKCMTSSGFILTQYFLFHALNILIQRASYPNLNKLQN